MSFSSTANTTPYSAIITPSQINNSTFGNPRINTYTALFVVNAVKNTAPVIVASGYASASQACNGGTAAFIRNPINMK